MKRKNKILKGIECCLAMVRCDQCPYNKYRGEYRRRECMKKLMLDVCQEIGMDIPDEWKEED